MDLVARAALANALMCDDQTPAAVTAAFLSRHPEWAARFGEAGRQRCTEDARLRLGFLAGAVQAGAPQLFADYATWCAQTLASRGIDHVHLAEHLELLAMGLVLEPEARDIVYRTIDAARLALANGLSTEVHDSVAETPLCIAYLTAALGGRRDAAWDVTRQALRERYSVARIYRDVVIAAQLRLGELWAEAKITVAQTHMASSVTQWVITHLYAEIPGDRSKGSALIVGVEGELHSLPAQLAADLLELDGWDVAFVGTNAPLQRVLATIEAQKPDVVGFSATMPSSLPRTVTMARALQAKFTTLRVAVGGRAFFGASKLVSELGVELAP